MTDNQSADPAFNALQEFVKKRIEIKTHEETIERLKQECGELEDRAMKWFETHGVQNINMLDRVAFIKRQVFAAKAEGFDAERAVSRLKEGGFEDCAKETIGWQTLSARFREIGEELPLTLQEDFRMSEKYSIQVRKG